MPEIKMRNLRCELCLGFEKPVWGKLFRLVGNDDVNQTITFHTAHTRPWAQSLASQKEREKEKVVRLLDHTFVGLLCFLSLSVSVLLSLRKNLMFWYHRDDSALKSTECSWRDPR